MKTLILLRHAKSGWDDGIRRDFDRGLNDKGRRAATTVGRAMRDAGIEPDAAIASPARRVRETLEALWAGHGRRLEPEFDRRLYLAPADMLLDVVQRAPTASGRLLVAGHNPGLADLVLALVPGRGGDGLRDDVEEKFPTASFAVLRFDVDDWGAVDHGGGGRLEHFVRPRDLDPSLGPDAD